ncbi:glycerol-3-phosphate acyltransferase [Phototrophicus methaneseepsis]|uniref:Glycerol-3-phosphate acyltransferase n=1 Tax=Phototrophicus methaneseepsis TaxID=2710758 RepID=A0A7S8IGJ0_9CHLR|nr:glycerol-3-phosphate acyltransferase [Phototrophicus methaneseepsis]QPC84704.1 glycerol-3-phosphate acyltransferase [Phototrophicus methaneseepsis]
MTVTEQNILPILLIIITSYLVGSIPTAYLLAKTRNINIFEVGSGNMGGTNVARALGTQWGVVTALLDMCKGIAAIVLARMVLPDEQWGATTISAIAVIVGHNWSLFATLFYHLAVKGKRLTLRGGKGAATAFGTMLMIAQPQIIVGMLAIGGVLIAITRYVSLGVLAAFALSIVWVYALATQDQLPVEYAPYAIILAMLLILRFRENIQRLARGQERRLGERV